MNIYENINKGFEKKNYPELEENINNLDESLTDSFISKCLEEYKDVMEELA